MSSAAALVPAHAWLTELCKEAEIDEVCVVGFADMMKNVNTVQMEELSEEQIAAARARRLKERCASLFSLFFIHFFCSSSLLITGLHLPSSVAELQSMACIQKQARACMQKPGRAFLLADAQVCAVALSYMRHGLAHT